MAKNRKPMSQRKYVKSLRCPNCRSNDVVAGGDENKDGIIEQEVDCQSCKASWFDVYTLRGYDRLEIPGRE